MEKHNLEGKLSLREQNKKPKINWNKKTIERARSDLFDVAHFLSGIVSNTYPDIIKNVREISDQLPYKDEYATTSFEDFVALRNRLITYKYKALSAAKDGDYDIDRPVALISRASHALSTIREVRGGQYTPCNPCTPGFPDLNHKNRLYESGLNNQKKIALIFLGLSALAIGGIVYISNKLENGQN